MFNYGFTLAKHFLAEGIDVFLGDLVHLHVLHYFFAVAKEFLAVGTRDVSHVLDRLLVFFNITQFHFLNQLCLINKYFLAEIPVKVMCFPVAGF